MNTWHRDVDMQLSLQVVLLGIAQAIHHGCWMFPATLTGKALFRAQAMRQ